MKLLKILTIWACLAVGAQVYIVNGKKVILK